MSYERQDTAGPIIVTCSYCGRTGTRAFVYQPPGGWLCKSKRSCQRRRDTWLAGFGIRRAGGR